MRYKGKRVRVREYKFGTRELIKEVEGKCVMSDQGNWLGLNSWFHIRDDEGELHIFGGSDHFNIEVIEKGGEIKVKKGKKVLGYNTTIWNKDGPDRLSVIVVGQVTKSSFVKTVSAEFNIIKKQVREGVSETKNEVEVELATSKVGTIFILNEQQEVLKEI